MFKRHQNEIEAEIKTPEDFAGYLRETCPGQYSLGGY
jgi:hypothetical protein